jgi:hypothetical protein
MHLISESTLPTKVAALVSTTTAATGGTYWAGFLPQTVGGVASAIGIIGVLISVTIAIMRYNREQTALEEDRFQRRERRSEEKAEARLRIVLLEQDIKENKLELEKEDF